MTVAAEPIEITIDRNVEEEPFGLYEVQPCLGCNGTGQRADHTGPVTVNYGCPDCKGHATMLCQIATCPTVEAIGVALETLAQDRIDAGESYETPVIGVLDRRRGLWLSSCWSPAR